MSLIRATSFSFLQSGSTFSFLPQETEDDSDSAAVDEKPVGTVEEILKNPWQTTQLPYDSSSDSDDYNEEGMDIDDATGNGDTLNKSIFQLKELFFFHADDPELENRINGKLSLVISCNSMLCVFSQKRRRVPLFVSKTGETCLQGGVPTCHERFRRVAGKCEDAENAHFGHVPLHLSVSFHGSMDVRIYLYSVLAFTVRSLDN